ncbi:hypothetical protein N7468_007614 [Penicillium chermesinum]|uniref:Uncharacterized protein n=1 Tax=Penicillium chermesinum TaxID=63820 RepID=A0A9W9NXB6_9EURO|nr:uncharacterized protein N7468_007614 [Penicillium chermesinum]KAJ5226389.1 hypothetical protein N7468_007614 [Penicillium chermesinum]
MDHRLFRFFRLSRDATLAWHIFYQTRMGEQPPENEPTPEESKQPQMGERCNCLKRGGGKGQSSQAQGWGLFP